MPRRKKQQQKAQYPEPPPDYYGSLEYGMDDYDNPLDKMTPEEIRQLANYVKMVQGGWYTDDFEDSSDSDNGEQANYAPPPDPLYPGDYTDDSDDEK